MLKNIEADEAADILASLPAAPGTETAKLTEAQGRVLAGDLYAALPVPPFDRSPFDGYAFRGADTRGATKDTPVVLKITEEIPAGRMPSFEIRPGFAAKILTGAPIPVGADATVKFEDTAYTADTVTLFEPVAPDTNVIRAGDDIKAGALLAPRGTRVEPSLLGVLAGQGLVTIPVYKRPAVTVVNTGSELVETGNPLPPGMIYNSNVHTLCGYLRDMGAEPRNGGVAADDPEGIARRVGEALAVSDMVITTGGASVGDYDFTLEAARLLGATILFWKIRMKPGGAILAAVKDDKLFLGLSGNPGAAVLGLLRIGGSYVRKLCGRADLKLPVIRVALKEPLTKASPRLRLLRGRLEICDGAAYFAETGGQGGSAAASLVGCDLLGEIEAGSPPLPAGTVIRAYRLQVTS